MRSSLVLAAAGQVSLEVPLDEPILVWGGVVLVALLANLLARQVIVRGVRKLVEKTKTTWDDSLVEHRVFERLSHLAPALVVHSAADLLLPDHPEGAAWIRRLANVWMVLAGARAGSALVNALVGVGMRDEATRDKPIQSYAQVVKLLLWLTVSILVVAIVMEKSPLTLLTGLGAMTAVLMLVFKDSILGLVASVQIASYDMVRVGDWIEMPKFGADGDVIEIGLHTVKVQNWDKTITAIPTHAFLSDSFKNWRGMTESGGRRIKRSLAIDMGSVRFLEDADLERLGEIEILRPYLAGKAAELAAWNAEHGTDASHAASRANGRRLTNLGTLRAYVEAYLREKQELRQDMTFLVRQLKPSALGLPLEIYVFSGEQRWIFYEGLLADIFDHLLAVLPEFDLRVFQEPSGADLAALRASREA